MKTPAHWYMDEPNWLARLLSPLGRMYQAVTEDRLTRIEPRYAECPVLCVGNLVAGGSGKTPMVRYLVKRATEMGITTHVVSKGYGGSAEGPMLVIPKVHQAHQVGDEPRELAELGCTVWVSKDRCAGVEAALRNEAELIILDDGMQTPHVQKDATIMMVDGASGFGNGLGIPAGPLRSRVGFGASRATLAVILGEDATGAREQLPPELPVLSASLTVGELMHVDAPPKRVYGICGIARPDRFEQSLLGLEAKLVGFESFDDHHAFTAAEVAALNAKAEAKNATLVTTFKDWMRIKDVSDVAPAVLPVELVLDDPEGRVEALLKSLTAEA